MYSTNKILGLTFLSALILLFTGCNIAGSNSSGERKVSVKMQVPTSTTSQKITGSSTTQAVDSLTEVKMLVEELELESSLDQDSLDFEVEDLVVNLPLDGSEFKLVSENVPEGVYDEFETKIESPDEDSNVEDSDFYNNSSEDGENYSIVVKGIYNGEKFTYRSEEDFELKLEMDPPLEISGNSSPSVAINVNPASWFKDSSGNDIDPNDPDNRETIDENIENSFEAEKDDDDDDDGGDDDDSDS